MAGAIPGALVFLGALTGRIFDSGLGLLVLFGAGIYISRQMKKAFSSPPVPDSAIAPPGVTPTLGIG